MECSTSCILSLGGLSNIILAAFLEAFSPRRKLTTDTRSNYTTEAIRIRYIQDWREIKAFEMGPNIQNYVFCLPFANNIDLTWTEMSKRKLQGTRQPPCYEKLTEFTPSTNLTSIRKAFL